MNLQYQLAILPLLVWDLDPLNSFTPMVGLVGKFINCFLLTARLMTNSVFSSNNDAPTLL